MQTNFFAHHSAVMLYFTATAVGEGRAPPAFSQEHKRRKNKIHQERKTRGAREMRLLPYRNFLICDIAAIFQLIKYTGGASPSPTTEYLMLYLYKRRQIVWRNFSVQSAAVISSYL